MMEYTLAVFLALFALIALDHVLRTDLFPPSRRLLTCMLIFGIAQLVFDNFFTQLGVWRFNADEVIGIWLPVIPIENLIFGQELLLLTLIMYTWFHSAH